MTTIDTTAAVIRVHGAQQPDTVALVCGDETMTYAELDRRSSQVANALLGEGVGADDRVAFLDKNGVEYFEVVFGGAKINAVGVAVNWRLAAPEIAFIVNDSEATVFVFGQEYGDIVASIKDDLQFAKRLLVIGDDPRFDSYDAWRDAADATDPGVVPGGSDICFQLYSSGTTGRPKGVMLTNDNLFELMPASSEVWGMGPSMVNMVAMPLFHIGGGGWAMVGLHNGGTSIIVREIDPAALIDLIGGHGITHAFLVPAVLQFMQMMPNAASGDFSSLDMIVYGASPISEEVLAGAVRLFGCKFAQAYGLTETTGAIVTLPPEDHDPDGPNRHRLRSAGKPNDNVEIKIVLPETPDDAEAPTGTPGEIWTRSGQNMAGYWHMPEETAKTMTADGWFKTGDVGYFDEDGYLYIHDRVKDMIVSGGENVYPAEIENALMKHPAIADVAVIGIPSERWGESPLAIVVPVEGQTIDEAEVLAFAREHLAGFKIPSGVQTIDVIPRNPTGKVLKKDLRAPFWEGRDRGVN